MEPRAYKFFNNHSRGISGLTIIFRLIHVRAPHIVWMNDEVQSSLSTLEFKNGEHLEDFHSRIIRLQQKINLSVETASPEIIIFHYMK